MYSHAHFGRVKARKQMYSQRVLSSKKAEVGCRRFSQAAAERVLVREFKMGLGPAATLVFQDLGAGQATGSHSITTWNNGSKNHQLMLRRLRSW